MLKEYFHSEAGFYFRKKWFYAMLLLFLGLGYFMSVKASLSFPGVYVNSPYVLTYAIGLISLINIFTITILSAQILLREKEANFDAILYATSLNKKDFLISRFGLILLITVLSYFLFVLGFMTGHIMQGNNSEKFMDFHFINYLYPFLVMVLPNAILCTAVVCTAGWLSKNNMLIYLSGLFIYILYMAVSLFSNSPLFANASPVSADTMSLMAKLDPFGMAAFFEQTKKWPPLLRNTQLVQLQGNFLLNRVAIMFVSAVLLFVSERCYRFTTGKKEKSRAQKADETIAVAGIVIKPVPTINSGIAYDWRTLWSFVKLDTRSIVKSIPFVLIVLLWVFFLGMEIYSDIDAGIRLPQRYATTGLMVNNIIGSFSFFILAVLLFYGVEMLWRSKNVKIDAVENTTPVNASTILAAKCVSLSIVPLLLISVSILFCVILQYLFQYPRIEWNVYGSLFYILGIPAILGAAIIVSIQAITRKKYPGLVLAALFLLLTNSFVGNMLGVGHPLFRFAKSFVGNRTDMNGFGAYLDAFAIKMVYWAAFTIIVGLLASHIWGAVKLKPVTWIVVALCFITLIGSGKIIKNKTVMESKAAQANWQQEYEQAYRKYQNTPQPGIAAVKTSIDLFPDSSRYSIKGSYVLVNKNTVPLDSLLLYCNRSVVLRDVRIDNAKLIVGDALFGHYRYRLLKPLQPGDSINMQFEIDYSWLPYNRHDPVNAIVGNGSFMRISRYYPVFGYQSGNEIEDEADRTRRKMAAATPLKKLEDKSGGDDYGFINFEAVISTTEKQTAIGTGELVKNWTEKGRNYFQYRSPVPIPFRFAVSSAEYAVKRVSQNGVSIAVYYHPAHAENVAHLAEEARNTIAYCEKNFGKYPFRSVSFAEISGFTEGFAATAYPATIFMSESVVFHADIRKDDKRDVINELAGHELSHEWWGNNQISPEDREGAAMLTETLAMYTELMLYKQTHGTEAMKQVVAMHQSIYENAKVYSTNEPLYKVQPGNVYLAYNKGLVVMYELYELIGEKKINTALKNFLAKYAFPNKPPTTVDLIGEFLEVSDAAVHERIKKLFRS